MVGALDAQQRELWSLVERATDAELIAATRCDGWSATDVLLHLAQTNEMAVASVEGRLAEAASAMGSTDAPPRDVDEWADAAVALERGATPRAIRDRWWQSAQDQVAAFREVDASTRVQWVAGTMAARSLATTRLAEGWIHTVDVASAWNTRPEPTDRLWHIARLVWRTVPYAFVRAGVELHGQVAFDLDAPGGGTWRFDPRDGDVATTVRGPAEDLCEVAGQRADAATTGLSAEGADAEVVLSLVRTFA